MFKMIHMRDSGWRRLGEALAVLGVSLLVSGVAAYAANFRDYVAVLIVFGGILVVVGAGLVAIAFFGKNQPDIVEENNSASKAKI